MVLNDLLTPENSGESDTGFSSEGASDAAGPSTGVGIHQAATDTDSDASSIVGSLSDGMSDTATERGDATLGDSTLLENDHQGDRTLEAAAMNPPFVRSQDDVSGHHASEDGSSSSYGEASDEEGYAESTSSMLDSLVLDHAGTRHMASTIPPGPFASEYDIPLHIDLFPERRRGLESGHEELIKNRGKLPFFEYLYGP